MTAENVTAEKTGTENLRLFWPEPATEWVEALPIGNGRIGAMLFGGADEARVQLNDATWWSGTPSGPEDALRALREHGAGPALLAEVRQAIDAEDVFAAAELLKGFQAPYTQEFLPLADLLVTTRATSGGTGWVYTGRELDLDDAVCIEHFQDRDLRVTRRSWASRPAGAVCIEIVAEGRLIDVTARLSASFPLAGEGSAEGVLAIGLLAPIDGVPLHEESREPWKHAPAADGFDPFAAVALAADSDGVLTSDGPTLTVRGATRVFLAIASSTNAAHWWGQSGSSEDRLRRLSRLARSERFGEAMSAARRAVACGSPAAWAEHRADIAPLLAAARVRIGSRRQGRIDVAEVLSGRDDALAATVLTQYGRYLLASASRPGSPPANLQGIWNDQARPAWSSNYTVNINTQMNYWLAEPGAMGECHLPLIDLLEKIAERGRAVAAALYGAEGWVLHHNTDLWGWALPVGAGHGDPSWAFWPMGGVWLSRHAWEHYAYTLDTGFLRERAWPLLKGAAEFALSWLVPGEDGALRTIPSTSPENHYLTADGSVQSVGVSTASDLALLRDLLQNTQDAAAVLGVEGDVVARIRGALDRLPPVSIRSDGIIDEWGQGQDSEDPHHRHLSPLVGLYPLDQIDAETTPALAGAARRLLDSRGPGAMGWSWAWKMALRARLGEGEAVRELFREAATPLAGDLRRFAPVDGSEWGGLLPNLFSAHPPFQIDGNFGIPAAIIEAIVYRVGDTIRLLPALPDAWPDGAIEGVRLPGGIAIDLSWQAKIPVRAVVRRVAGDAVEKVRVVWGAQSRSVELRPGSEVVVELLHREVFL